MTMWVRQRMFLIVLVASLALNLGIGATFGVRSLHASEEMRRAHASLHAARSHDDEGETHASPFAPLNLNPEQEKYIYEAHQEIFEKARTLQPELGAINERLTALMLADDPDRDAIEKELDELMATRKDTAMFLMELLFDFRTMLQEDQVEAFKIVLRDHMLFPISHGIPPGSPELRHGSYTGDEG